MWIERNSGSNREQQIAGQKIAVEKTRQSLSDPVLVCRHDCGVRDRQPEGVAKQRGHREPVGKPSDQGRLGDGAQQEDAGAGIGDGEARGKHRGCGGQHAGRHRLRTAQPTKLPLLQFVRSHHPWQLPTR
jgi:hypothetical protein